MTANLKHPSGVRPYTARCLRYTGLSQSSRSSGTFRCSRHVTGMLGFRCLSESTRGTTTLVLWRRSKSIGRPTRRAGSVPPIDYYPQEPAVVAILIFVDKLDYRLRGRSSRPRRKLTLH